MKKLGRPTSYRKSFPQKAEILWSKGMTDDEVARKLKVAVRQIYEWFKRYPEFTQAKERAKGIADALVERALFKRAVGFVAPDCHVSQFEGDITITKLDKHYPPDTAAAVFWLKNRKPKEWRDRSEILLSEEVAGVPADVVEGLRKRFLETTGPSSNGNGNGNGH